jgi:serine/threonine-protein kinase
VYHVEAWMPQAVAVMKLQGFVRDLGGKVVASVPGLLRVHLLEKKPAAGNPDDLWSFLGLFQQPPSPEPRVLSVVELHMRTSDHANQTRLRVDIHFYPGNDPDLEEMEERAWQTYCDKTFCELRGFLMHAR